MGETKRMAEWLARARRALGRDIGAANDNAFSALVHPLAVPRLDPACDPEFARGGADKASRLLKSALFGLALCLAGAPASAQIADTALAGRWFGESAGGEDGPRTQWIAEFRPDGRFEVEFRVAPDCAPGVRHRERGLWAAAGPVFFTLTLDVDGKATEPATEGVQDAYLILFLDEHELAARHLRSGEGHRSRRVPPEFRLADCAL